MMGRTLISRAICRKAEKAGSFPFGTPAKGFPPNTPSRPTYCSGLELKWESCPIRR